MTQANLRDYVIEILPTKFSPPPLSTHRVVSSHLVARFEFC